MTNSVLRLILVAATTLTVAAPSLAADMPENWRQHRGAQPAISDPGGGDTSCVDHASPCCAELHGMNLLQRITFLRQYPQCRVPHPDDVEDNGGSNGGGDENGGSGGNNGGDPGTNGGGANNGGGGNNGGSGGGNNGGGGGGDN